MSRANGFRYEGEGKTWTFTNNSGGEIAAHTPVRSGALNGVTVTNVLDGEPVQCHSGGLWNFKKPDGIAMAQGDEVFLSGDTMVKDPGAGTHYVFAFVFRSATAEAAEVTVCLASPGHQRVVA